MKERDFDIQKYMTKGVERVVKDSLRATLKDPAESIFMASFARAAKKASETRLKYKEEGLHVPPFLIASITSNCNLHCAGCYSRQNEATKDCKPVDQMTGAEWSNIFSEARDLGISFILLAGGEPLLRKDVIQAAANIRKFFSLYLQTVCSLVMNISRCLTRIVTLYLS